TGEIPGAVAGEQVEFQGRSDVDAVQLAGVLVTELSRDEGTDVATRRVVPGMAERGSAGWDRARRPACA
ncbi:MAG TPA: hypothetical protein VG253_29040, partial [Streptosporangiaceae bacterium]|nr:hypothetical protein [Streptosporangiaceae bacterium]